MKVKATQREDFHFVSVGPSGREVPIDAADYVGGRGRGLRPPELLFHAIAGCVGIHLHEALRHEGLNPQSIAVETDAERKTDGYPRTFTRIHLLVTVRGGGLTEEQVRKAMEKTIHDPGTCSIAWMMDRIAPVDYVIQIET